MTTAIRVACGVIFSFPAGRGGGYKQHTVKIAAVYTAANSSSESGSAPPRCGHSTQCSCHSTLAASSATNKGPGAHIAGFQQRNAARAPQIQQQERIATAMQGIHHASGNLPVACTKTLPAPPPNRSMAPIGHHGWISRGGSLCVYSSTASTSAKAVYRRGISGSVLMNPHSRSNPPAPP